jgi:SAM-dependent methyltransferase
MSNIDTIADFTFNNQQFLLKTSKFEDHLPYLWLQSSGDQSWVQFSLLSEEQKKQFIKDLALKRFNQWIEFYPINQNTKSIIDVGSGLAIADLLISQLRPDIDFYLVDRNTNLLDWDYSREYSYFSKSLDDEDYHGFYNSFDITRDIITNSPINSERINFLVPEDEWPNEVDLVVSSFSWMWHYHKNIYWDRLLKSLKVGGHLAITITLREQEYFINEISNDLGSYPCMCMLIDPDQTLEKGRKGVDQVIHTGYYVWQRMK